RKEPSTEVRSQLASSCKRLPAQKALPIIRELLLRGEDVADLHIPLLLWWALESKLSSDLTGSLKMLEERELWESPLFKKHIATRLGRRFATERGDKFSYTLHEAEYSEWLPNYNAERCRASLKVCSRLLDLAPTSEMKDQLVLGMEEGLRGQAVELDPSPLQEKISQM